MVFFIRSCLATLICGRPAIVVSCVCLAMSCLLFLTSYLAVSCLVSLFKIVLPSLFQNCLVLSLYRQDKDKSKGKTRCNYLIILVMCWCGSDYSSLISFCRYFAMTLSWVRVGVRVRIRVRAKIRAGFRVRVEFMVRVRVKGQGGLLCLVL